MSEKRIKLIYEIATGSSNKRKLYTPLGALLFFTVTALFILIPLLIERVLDIRQFIFSSWNIVISMPFIAIGLFYTLWSMIEFFKSKGTPVPFNPPPALIVKGPYKYSRNPMTAGLFLQMAGLGILLGSILLTFVFTPLYILMHYHQLKTLEEPELELRLGKAYMEYKSKVPMFLPWKKN
jgi:protein-S-isoprenylcysteine O-methyltransferase Ste14